MTWTINGRRTLPAVLFWVLLFGLAACAPRGAGPDKTVDFSQYRDRALPAEALVWLDAGSQSRISPMVAAEAARIKGNCRRERLFKAVAHVWDTFRFDAWLSDKAFSRGADQIFSERVMGGCSDYALVQAVLFRALGIPARLVVTANARWMTDFQQNDLMLPEGHVFIEVYLEDRWYLVDATYRYLYFHYDTGMKNFPRDQVRCWQGLDYWAGGIDSVAQVSRLLKAEANTFRAGDYQDPDYPWVEIRQIP